MNSTSPNWAVLRECGQVPKQFYWFRSVIRFYNGMLASNSQLVRQVLRADVQLGERYPRCWAAQVRKAFDGLPNADMYDQAVHDLEPVWTSCFIPDLHSRQQAVWRVVEKFSAYHHWFALPLGSNEEACKCPARLPLYLTLDLPRHVSRHTSCFRLRAHRLGVKSAHWLGHQHVFCECGCNERQDEKHVLFYCRHPAVCNLRDEYFDFFQGRTLGFAFRSSSAGTNLYLEPTCVIQDWQTSEFMQA